MLTHEVKTLLQRTLTIDHIDDDRIVLRGPINRGADLPLLALIVNPAPLFFLGLLVWFLVGPESFGEALAVASPDQLRLLVLILLSVLVTVGSIILMRRRRIVRIALHRGQYLAHFYGPNGIDICLPLMHPYLWASGTENGNSTTIWKSPSAYKVRENRKPWRRHMRLWPMGRIPELSLSFPDSDWVDIVPVPGARETDFIACWEWLLQFIVPARASARATPPRRVFRLPGAARMLREMSLHSFTEEKLGLIWATTAGALLRAFTLTFTAGFSGLAFFGLIEGNGMFPPWVALVCCPLSTAAAILVSFRAYPIVTNFTRGTAGASIEGLRRRERIEEVRIGLETYDGQDQFLMFTPHGILRGRHVYRKAIVDCAVFIEQFCKPPVETEGVDVDV